MKTSSALSLHISKKMVAERGGVIESHSGGMCASEDKLT